MCDVCTEAVHSVALWTRVASQLWTCQVCTEAVHREALWTRVTSQLWTCVKYVRKQSTAYHFESGYTTLGHVWSMYPSNPPRSTLNTGYITALDMCEVCTEAVHSVALWTRATSQLWTCVKNVPKNTGCIIALDMCDVCMEAVQRVKPQHWTCVKNVPTQSIP